MARESPNVIATGRTASVGHVAYRLTRTIPNAGLDECMIDQADGDKMPTQTELGGNAQNQSSSLTTQLAEEFLLLFWWLD